MSSGAISSCRDVDDELIDASVMPARDRAVSLLTQMAAVARPADGASRMLAVLACMAKSEWLDGMLEVRLESFGFATQLDVLVFDGQSFERLTPPLLVRAPFEEFVLSVAQDAEELRPLELHWDDPGIELVLRGWEPPVDSTRSEPPDLATVPAEMAMPHEAFPGDSELPTEPKIPAAPRVGSHK